MSLQLVCNSFKKCKLLKIKGFFHLQGVWNYSHSMVPGGLELMS